VITKEHCSVAADQRDGIAGEIWGKEFYRSFNKESALLPKEEVFEK
jgi:hypothetical protein